jgi:hypothetical protein
MNESGKTKEKNNEIFYFILLFGLNLQAQNRVSETILPQKLEFTFNEYLGYVKNFIRWLKQLI